MFIIAFIASVLHVLWAVLIWNSPPIHNIPLSGFYSIVDTSRQVALLLLFVSALAIFGKVRWKRGGKLFWSLLPQQASLMVTAWVAWVCIMNSAYADGVLRPRDFIATDQLGNIIPAVVHSFYVIWVFIDWCNPATKGQKEQSECGVTACPLRQ